LPITAIFGPRRPTSAGLRARHGVAQDGADKLSASKARRGNLCRAKDNAGFFRNKAVRNGLQLGTRLLRARVSDAEKPL
jgi:hypothetical protein